MITDAACCECICLMGCLVVFNVISLLTDGVVFVSLLSGEMR